MGIETVPQPHYCRDLAPCDFWLFPKLRGCRYKTIEEIERSCDEGHWHAYTRGRKKYGNLFNDPRINSRSQCLGQEWNKYLEIKIIQNWKQNFAGSLTIIIIPRKAKFTVKYTIFKPQGQKTISKMRQKIPDLAGSWLQDVLTMWMRWEILSDVVDKSPSVDISKELGLSPAM